MNGKPTTIIPKAIARRSFRPLCRRCGRQVEPGHSAPIGGVPRCRSCHGVDISRFHGQTSFDYSPFRLLARNMAPYLRVDAAAPATSMAGVG